MMDIMLIVFIVIEAVVIAYLYNKATRQKKMDISAMLHVFEEDVGVSLELVSLLPVEDLISKKEFIACVVKHDRRYLSDLESEKKHVRSVEITH